MEFAALKRHLAIALIVYAPVRKSLYRNRLYRPLLYGDAERNVDNLAVGEGVADVDVLRAHSSRVVTGAHRFGYRDAPNGAVLKSYQQIRIIEIERLPLYKIVIRVGNFQRAGCGSVTVDVDLHGNAVVPIINLYVLRAQNRRIERRNHGAVYLNYAIGAVCVDYPYRSTGIIKFLSDKVIRPRRRIDLKVIDIVFLFTGGKTNKRRHRHSQNRNNRNNTLLSHTYL